MKRRAFIRRPVLAATALAVATFAASAAESMDDTLNRAAQKYAERFEAATQELNRTREKIAAEEAPLAKSVKELQGRITALEAETARFETDQARAMGTLGQVQQDLDGLQRNLTYVTSQGLDAFKSFSDSLLPGEKAALGEPFKNLQGKFEDAGRPAGPDAALETLRIFSEHLRRATGGYRASGSSLVGSDNRVRSGTFVFLGPEVFFQTDDGEARGTVRSRAGDGLYPVTHSLPDWAKAKAAPLFAGQMGLVPLDPSGGKALRLQETKGTFLAHIHRGGVVAYLIVAVGALALGLIVLKTIDAQNLAVDEPERLRPILALVAQGRLDEAGRMVPSLRSATRAVFSTGLQHFGKTREALEEHLLALIQAQRLHFERRLPLLTVIATASPLLGLLGTVMGMVKTFALITVFGTGNAAKLSSGISEVLVTTELGLAVAIPTLVAHGFLAHRIHKKLSLLERQASEFAAAAEDARSEPSAPPRRPSIV